MADILYLVHRLPYPPNKGDKVRSYHLLKHLALAHRVHLGTFIDNPADEQYVDTVRKLCASLHVARLDPVAAKIRALGGVLRGRSLTMPYYADAGLRRWVGDTVREHGIGTAVVFSSAMAQYVTPFADMRMLVDFVDVDSAKWTQYAGQHRWPMSWLYRREGLRLLDYERDIALRAARGFFVTAAEAELFTRLAPDCASRVEAVGNGVDADFFSPTDARESPFLPGEVAIVFTGAMDYWPNVDAVSWFVAEVLPRLQAQGRQVRFHIVGRAPTPAVTALAGAHVLVTGTVPDVRPYLQHAALVVAPLRIARGIQNKILEAMAMAKAVVVSQSCAGALDATPDHDFLAAESAEDFATRINALLAAPQLAAAMGRSAREAVVSRYSWEASMRGIDRHLSADATCFATARLEPA